MSLDHQFDWRGLVFSAKLIAVCLTIGVAGQYGLVFARAYAESLTANTLAVEASSQTATATAGFASSTPERVISLLSIQDAVPEKGKFIAADLVYMRMYLYNDGRIVEEYPILTKGRPNSPFETPSGFYEIGYKEQNHFNKGAQVYLPYSMQFYGNYFIHGWPYHADGSPVDPAYSGGCIRLSTEDAKKVFAFADRGTGVFVYDSKQKSSVPSLVLDAIPPPTVSAASYLVADIDTGDVLLDRDAKTARPIASVTKLMTALVANEIIMFDKEITVSSVDLIRKPASTTPVVDARFAVGDLLYPLLMESNNSIAASIAKFYGTPGFIGWMNTTAKSLGMTSTGYADASGISPENVSTTEDLYRLAVYLTNKKSFVWNISRTPTKTLVAPDGTAYSFNNFNVYFHLPSFVGGKVGRTGQALDTMVSVFSMPINGVDRRVAVIVLRSTDSTADTTNLTEWFTKSATRGAAHAGTACTSCSLLTQFRKIPL